jgi:transcriptional regulator with XRE-family HTH domain
MLTLDKIVGLLKDRRLDIVSDATGIHRNTLSGIRAGKITNPTYETVKRLSEYFDDRS